MCHSCNVLRINGHLCHEHGCAESWRDEVRECKECGYEFKPAHKYQELCSPHCFAMYSGQACQCEDCQELDNAYLYEMSEAGQGALGLLIPLAFVAVIIAYLLTQINGGLFAQLLGGL